MKKEENKIVDFFDKKKDVNKSTKKATAKKKTSKKIKQKPKVARKTRKKRVVSQKTTTKKNVEQKRANVFEGVFKGGAKKIRQKPKKTSPTKSIGEFINWILLAFIFLISFFVTNQTFQGIDFEKNFLFISILAILFLFISLQFINRKEIKIRKTFLDKYLLGIVIIYLLATWFSVDRWHSLVGFIGNPTKGLMTIFTLIGAFYITVTNFSIQTAKKAFWMMVIVISLLTFYTLISGFGLIPTKLQTLIPFSLTGSLTGLTAVLSAGIPLVATALLIIKSQSKKLTFLKQLLLVIILGGIILALTMLYNFVFWSSVVAGVIIVAFLLLGYKQPRQKNKLVKGTIFTLLAIIIIVAGLAKSNYQSVIPVLSKIGLPIEVKVGLPVSYTIVKESVVSNLKQSLIGSGPATFGYDFAKFHSAKAVAPTLESQYIYQGDGFMGELIPTVGIVGGFIFLIMAIAWLLKGFKSLVTKKQTRIYLVGLFSASIVWLGNALFRQLDAGTIFFGSFLLIIATIFILENSKDKKNNYIIKLNKFNTKSLITIIGLLLFIGATVAGFVYVSKAYFAEKHLKKAMTAKSLNDKPAKILQSINLNSQEGMYYAKLGQTYLILAQEEDLKKDTDKNKIKTLSKKALDYNRKAVSLMPNDILTRRILAETYTALGYISPAEQEYQKIISLEPDNVQYYVALGDLQLLKINNKTNNKDEMVKKAIDFYDKALKVNPYTDVIYYKLAMIYAENDDIDNALKNMAIAVKLQPKNQVYKFTLGVLLQKKGGDKELAGAEKLFKALLLSNDKSIDVLAQLGLLYEQENKIDEAKKQYQKIIDIIGDNEKYQAISKTMQKFIDNLNNGQSNIPDKNDKQIKNEIQKQRIILRKISPLKNPQKTIIAKMR